MRGNNQTDEEKEYERNNWYKLDEETGLIDCDGYDEDEKDEDQNYYYD